MANPKTTHPRRRPLLPFTSAINRSLKYLALFALPALLFPAVCGAQPNARKTLTILTHEESPIEERLYFLPLASYLARRLGDLGYVDGDVYVAAEFDDAARFFREKKPEIIIDSPISALTAGANGSIPILRRWKEGDDAYHSVFFVHKDSTVNTINDLRGKVLAVKSIDTDSAYTIPRIDLNGMGYQMIEQRGGEWTGPKDAVGYTISGDYETTITWVLYRKTDAGVLYDRFLEERFPHFEKHFRIIHRTPPIPRHIVSIRQDLPADLAARIKQILMEMNGDAEGQNVLRRFQKTTKFDPIPPAQIGTLELYRKALGSPE